MSDPWHEPADWAMRDFCVRSQAPPVEATPVIDRSECDYHAQEPFEPVQGTKVAPIMLGDTIELEFYFILNELPPEDYDWYGCSSFFRWCSRERLT